MSQQDRYFSQKLHDLDQAIQDVRLIAYGKYSNGTCSNPLQSIARTSGNKPKRRLCENLPCHQILELDPKMTSHSETCIIVISDDSETVDDDDVFAS